MNNISRSIGLWLLIKVKVQLIISLLMEVDKLSIKKVLPKKRKRKIAIFVEKKLLN
jgi:hypothetical protein